MLKEICEAVGSTLQFGQLSKGKMVTKFEEKVAKYVGTKHAVALNSCTSGLQVVLEALDIGLRDKVICPNFTYWSTPQAIRNVGAEPMFVDVQDDYCSYTCHKSVISFSDDRIFAGIAVDLFGNYSCCNYISENADYDYPPIVIRDAACGLGINYKDLIRYDDDLVFSFHPRKLITTGEGGMICTNDDVLAARLKVKCGYGRRVIKYNLRMNEIQAVMGLVQMEYLDQIIENRQRAAKIYDDLITDQLKDKVKIHPHQNEVRQTYQSYVCLLQPDNNEYFNEGVIGKMRELGVETQVGSYIMDHTPAYGYSNSWKFHIGCLSLPIYFKVREETQKIVIEKLKECLK